MKPVHINSFSCFCPACQKKRRVVSDGYTAREIALLFVLSAVAGFAVAVLS